jgi:hypothetical protein
MTIENNVIITGYKNPTSEGIILCLNKSTSLKTGNVRGTEFWVSWDKIGKDLINLERETNEKIRIFNSFTFSLPVPSPGKVSSEVWIFPI